jgi:hypothetical protein
MKTMVVPSYVKNGERQFSSQEARAIAGIQNRGTWNDYLISIGLPTGEHFPTLTMTDLIWIWVCKRWLAQNKRKSGISTHRTFRRIKNKTLESGEFSYGLNDFLETLNTDLLTVTIEVQQAIHGYQQRRFKDR